MIEMLLEIVRFLLWWYNLLVVLYVILSWVRIPANKWTELLHSAVEPGLEIARKLMDRFLPSLRKPGIDWSPVVLFVAIAILRVVLKWL